MKKTLFALLIVAAVCTCETTLQSSNTYHEIQDISGSQNIVSFKGRQVYTGKLTIKDQEPTPDGTYEVNLEALSDNLSTVPVSVSLESIKQIATLDNNNKDTKYVPVYLGCFNHLDDTYIALEKLDHYKMEQSYSRTSIKSLRERIDLMIRIAEPVGFAHFFGYALCTVSNQSFMITKDQKQIKIGDLRRIVRPNVRCSNLLTNFDAVDKHILELHSRKPDIKDIVEAPSSLIDSRVYDLFSLGMVFADMFSSAESPFSTWYQKWIETANEEVLAAKASQDLKSKTPPLKFEYAKKVEAKLRTSMVLRLGAHMLTIRNLVPKEKSDSDEEKDPVEFIVMKSIIMLIAKMMSSSQNGGLDAKRVLHTLYILRNHMKKQEAVPESKILYSTMQDITKEVTDSIKQNDFEKKIEELRKIYGRPGDDEANHEII